MVADLRVILCWCGDGQGHTWQPLDCCPVTPLSWTRVQVYPEVSPTT